MYEIKTNDNKLTIKGKREPKFTVWIDCDYEKFSSDQNLISAVDSYLAERKAIFTNHEWLKKSGILILLLEQIKDPNLAHIIAKKLKEPYWYTITINDEAVYREITRSYEEHRAWPDYLISDGIDETLVRNILSTRIHLIKLLKSGLDKTKAIGIFEDNAMVEYISANIEKITYKETKLSYHHTQTYFEFLCLLYPDRLVLIYSEEMDDLIICDIKNLAYSLNKFEWKSFIIAPKSVYNEDDPIIFELRKKYWYSIIDKVKDICWWYMADSSIDSFTIQKKIDNVLIKTTKVWRHADSVAQKVWEYWEVKIKTHRQNKVYEVTISQKIAKQDFLNAEEDTA